MASKPWFDARRGEWLMKYRPDPTGPWVRVKLCKHPVAWSPSKPPKKPPQEAVDRAREFAEIEYRTLHGLAAPPARAKGLAGYLAAYADAYEATRKRPGSVKQLRRHIRTFLAFAESRGITAVQALTKAHCRDYLEERVRAVSPGTLQAEKGYLSPIWTRAVDDGLMAVNPWKLVKVPGKKEAHKATFWTSEQVAAIARHCTRPWQSDLVLVLANTGLRISAALALRWDWVDWGRGSLTVPKEHSKSGRPYALALNRTARDVLERRQMTARGEDLVFPNPTRGGVVPYDSARAAIQRAIARAGVPHGTVHDLRHSYGRALERAGVPMAIIQAQLGHSSLAMTARYTSATEDEAAKYLEGFGVGDGPE